MNEPKAVLISDIHYSLANLSLADAALNQAVAMAKDLDVPLIIAGDLHDTKAMLRAECVNAILKTLSRLPQEQILLIPGNHDLINEKGEEHALKFLKHTVLTISSPMEYRGFHFIPYQTDKAKLTDILAQIPPKSLIIAHQGVHQAHAGEYVHDKTAVDCRLFQGHRTLSGHYHRKQDIDTGNGGRFSYLGTPYTVTFAEADDGPKGYNILYADHAIQLIPTNLRKHIKIQRTPTSTLFPIENYKPGDLVWMQVTGTTSELSKINKKKIGEKIHTQDFKLDLIPLDSTTPVANDIEKVNQCDVFDAIIEGQTDTVEHKNYLKKLWRDICD